MSQKRSPLLFRSPLMLGRIAAIQKLLERRPMTRTELAVGLGQAQKTVDEVLIHLRQTGRVYISSRQRKPGGGQSLNFLAWGSGEDAAELPRVIRLNAAQQEERLRQARAIRATPHPLTVALFGMVA